LIKTKTSLFNDFLKEDENILVILENLTKSYLLTGDGTSTPTIINQPEGKDSQKYAYRSQSAIVKDKLYIFGGNNYPTRVRTMNFGCFIDYEDVS
jgi:hypothetical protein